MSSDSNAQGCKVVLLGDSGVGKTCIISRYITGNFEKNSVSTNGASYCSKNVEYKKLGKNLLLDIWDTAGQEKYKALTKFFYKDAAICVLVYDITNKESFNNLKNFWYTQIKENNGTQIILGVCGNKCDLYENEEVEENDGRQFAEEIGAIFALTSAQNNTGISELFFNLGYKFLRPSYNPNADGNEVEAEVKEDTKEEKKDKKKDEKKIVLKKEDVRRRNRNKKSCC